jgi:hypothetical protein
VRLSRRFIVQTQSTGLIRGGRRAIEEAPTHRRGDLEQLGSIFKATLSVLWSQFADSLM